MRHPWKSGPSPVRARLAIRSAALAFFLIAGRGASADIIDPVGDFLPTYAGPHNADLDVISNDVIFDIPSDTFRFTATMNGAIGTTTGATYVWGLDRGKGTARFAAIGITGVTFDSVVVLSTTGGTVRDLIGGAALNLSTSDITVNGSTISASIPASSLVTEGLSKSQYTANLWPRLGSGNNNQIADFAPDNSNFTVRSVPEPASLSLLGLGAVGLVLRRVRRASRPR